MLRSAAALLAAMLALPAFAQAPVVTLTPKLVRADDGTLLPADAAASPVATVADDDPASAVEIGRASCRERVCMRV